MKNPFSQHPKSIGESYFEHMRHALSYAFWLLLAGISCLLHAIFPFLFQNVASDCIVRLVNKLSQGKRGASFKHKLSKGNQV